MLSYKYRTYTTSIFKRDIIFLNKCSHIFSTFFFSYSYDYIIPSFQLKILKQKHQTKS